jgi:hypothetical protein
VERGREDGRRRDLLQPSPLHTLWFKTILKIKCKKSLWRRKILRNSLHIIYSWALGSNLSTCRRGSGY